MLGRLSLGHHISRRSGAPIKFCALSSYVLCTLFGDVLTLPLNYFATFLRPAAWKAPIAIFRPHFEAARFNQCILSLTYPVAPLTSPHKYRNICSTCTPRGVMPSVNAFSAPWTTESPSFPPRDGSGAYWGLEAGSRKPWRRRLP